MPVQANVDYNLVLNEEERKELLRILEQYLVEIHMEKRRTEGPRYHEQVAHEEGVVKVLTDKVRQLGA